MRNRVCVCDSAGCVGPTQKQGVHVRLCWVCGGTGHGGRTRPTATDCPRAHEFTHPAPTSWHFVADLVAQWKREGKLDNNDTKSGELAAWLFKYRVQLEDDGITHDSDLVVRSGDGRITRSHTPFAPLRSPSLPFAPLRSPSLPFALLPSPPVPSPSLTRPVVHWLRSFHSVAHQDIEEDRYDDWLEKGRYPKVENRNFTRQIHDFTVTIYTGRYINR